MKGKTVRNATPALPARVLCVQSARLARQTGEGA